MLACAPEDRALLIEATPEIYFKTDHYRGWALALARMGAISAEDLRHRVESAWRMGASLNAMFFSEYQD